MIGDADDLGMPPLGAIDRQQSDGIVGQVERVEDEWAVSGQDHLPRLAVTANGQNLHEPPREPRVKGVAEVVDGEESGRLGMVEDDQGEQHVESTLARVVARQRVLGVLHEAIDETYDLGGDGNRRGHEIRGRSVNRDLFRPVDE